MGKGPEGTEGPAGGGTPPGTPPGTPDPNVVALQKVLTEKDRELKEAQAKLSELEKSKSPEEDTAAKAIGEMQKTIEELSNTITGMKTEKTRESLRAKYPDIVPDLLLGKSDDEIERLVKAQRETIEKTYSRLPSAHEPAFSDRSSVENAIKAVENDKKLSTMAKFEKLRDLKKALAEF